MRKTESLDEWRKTKKSRSSGFGISLWILEIYFKALDVTKKETTNFVYSIQRLCGNQKGLGGGKIVKLTKITAAYLIDAHGICQSDESYYGEIESLKTERVCHGFYSNP